MTVDPNAYEDDATDQGVSATDPAEGDNDVPAGGGDSPEPGVITGETADER
jgi:hypothetical protein